MSKRNWLMLIRYRQSLMLGFIATVFCIGMASRPPSNQFRFSDVEDHVTFLSDQQAQDKAQRYLDEHFPVGSSIQQAMVTLTKARAQCSYQIDPRNPGLYFCSYSRSAGLFEPFVDIDWGISLFFTSNKKSIKSIIVVRYTSGL